MEFRLRSQNDFSTQLDISPANNDNLFQQSVNILL